MFSLSNAKDLYWVVLVAFLFSKSKEQLYNMTGSSEYAELGKTFMWTCEMFVPSGMTDNAVFFQRNGKSCGLLAHNEDGCLKFDLNPRYTFACVSEYSYALTIPAENMTEYEEGSVWGCFYPGDGSYKSPHVVLNIAIDVHNVSMIPSDNPLTLIEGTKREIRCVVNINAVPPPTFTWYLGSKDISSSVGTDAASINITGKKVDNAKTLQCRASNNNKAPKSSSTMLNVAYPPIVSIPSSKDVIEGFNLSVKCQASPGNPNTTSFFWTKLNDLEFLNNGPMLQLSNVQKTSAGTYRCTGENTYFNGKKGRHSQDMAVDVLYGPEIENKAHTVVNETERVVLMRMIDSNPLSNVSWYDGTKLLKTQTATKTAILIIEDAKCTDSKNLTLVAGNTVQSNVTTYVELVVNCKPTPQNAEITFAIPEIPAKVEWSTIVIAYPEPRFTVKYINGTNNSRISMSLSKNSLNNFTIHCEQQVDQGNHLGTFYLEVSNILGSSEILLHIVKQGKPKAPTAIEVMCYVTTARIKWKSSYDGGTLQSFFVVALGDTYQSSRSDVIEDDGENKVHHATVPFLYPSSLYTFYVYAKNKYGVTLSEAQNCTTLKESSSGTGKIVGSIVGALVMLAFVISVSYFCKRRFTDRDRHNPAKPADLNKDTSIYTTIKKNQEENTERNLYNALTPDENQSQYESLHMADIRGSKTNTYESLKNNSSPSTDQKKDSNTSVFARRGSSEENIPKLSEEYTNTSSMK
uniref:Titin-like isoform X2 n=1 Tax=Crassostrea virginica TaxID=6565 RepID=A0A8B8BJW2_CRAVI|nr:titin-like isoform X2 [Crassostrea virginica]